MLDVAGKEPLTFHAAKMTLMVFLRSIVIDSLSLPVSSSGSGTGGNNNARPISIIDLPGLGQLRPALPVPDGALVHRHGVLAVDRCGGAGEAGRPTRRHPKRRQFAERGAQRLLIGRSAGGQIVAWHPGQRPSSRPRLLSSS